MITLTLILLMLLAIAITFLITFLVLHHHYNKLLKRKIKESLQGQRSKISGDFLEKFCPFAPSYPYNLNDVVAIFDTFDFMVLKGRTDGKIEEIIFQEMKSYTPSYLGIKSRQGQLKSCIINGRVRFEHWELDRETNTWHCKV